MTVSGSVDPSTVIKRLVRAGKHAELCNQKGNQIQNHQNNPVKNDKNNKAEKQSIMKSLEALKNQQKFPIFCPENDDCLDDEDEDEYDGEDDDELRSIMAAERMNQLGLLRQQQSMDVKKGLSSTAVSAGGKMNNNGGNTNALKKGVPNQNMEMKGNSNGIDQNTLAALKLNNPGPFGGGNFSAMEGKRLNDMNTIMGLAGINGNGSNFASALGGTTNGLGGFQINPNNGLQGSSSNAGLVTGQYPASMLMNMNGYNHPASMMNLQNRQVLQQPQMMYQRTPYIPPSTGYYYNYGPPNPYSYNAYNEPNYSHATHDSEAAQVFNDDERTDGCSIM